MPSEYDVFEVTSTVRPTTRSDDRLVTQPSRNTGRRCELFLPIPPASTRFHGPPVALRLPNR